MVRTCEAARVVFNSFPGLGIFWENELTPRELSPRVQNMISIQTMDTQTEQTTEAHLPRAMQVAIQKLMRIHGRGHLGRGKHGLHLYLPSPVALQRDGHAELNRRHLSVNLDRLMQGIEDGEADNRLSVGYCHKYETPYTYEDLLGMIPINRRIPGLPDEPTEFEDALQTLTGDPEEVGTVTPFSMLPANHPAREYLRNRPGGAFDEKLLEEQFRAAYCVKASTQFPKYHFPCGMPHSQTGRIVFRMFRGPREFAWQARLVEASNSHSIYYWNGRDQRYEKAATHCSHYSPDGGQTLPYEGRDDEKISPGFPAGYVAWPSFDEDRGGSKCNKYLIGKNSFKTDSFMGFDAAYTRSSGYDGAVILTEGVFDAARLYQAGYPAMAVLGKTLSDVQLRLLLTHFRRFFIMSDNDAGGAFFHERCVKDMAAHGREVQLIAVPSKAKDVAELSVSDLAFVNNYL